MSKEFCGVGNVVRRSRDDACSQLDLPPESELIEAAQALAASFEGTHSHNGVHTFFANAISKGVLPLLQQTDGASLPVDQAAVIDSLRFLLARRAAGRFQDFFDRKEFVGSEIPPHVISMSQGVPKVMHWRGVPLFKTIFDVCIYQMMLWDIKPGTIFETGTANGGSAVWLADLAKSFGLDCHIYTVDLHKPNLHHEGVSFIEGDCMRIDECFPPDLLASAPRPWILLEDAHVNVANVLRYFDQSMTLGDYMIVEDTDSVSKEDEINDFIKDRRDTFLVDTHYTDFFGYNACCSHDTIWRKS